MYRRTVTRCLFAFSCHGKADLQMYKAHGSYSPEGWWIWFCDPLLALQCTFKSRFKNKIVIYEVFARIIPQPFL